MWITGVQRKNSGRYKEVDNIVVGESPAIPTDPRTLSHQYSTASYGRNMAQTMAVTDFSTYPH
jgi:hypothetical protein